MSPDKFLGSKYHRNASGKLTVLPPPGPLVGVGGGDRERGTEKGMEWASKEKGEEDRGRKEVFLCLDRSSQHPSHDSHGNRVFYM